jgi:hypothetical protein
MTDKEQLPTPPPVTEVPIWLHGFPKLYQHIPPVTEVPIWRREKPTGPGVYAWRAGNTFAMVHVHRLPTAYSDEGILNGTVLGKNDVVYDGCAISEWGGYWIGPFLPEKV